MAQNQFEVGNRVSFNIGKETGPVGLGIVAGVTKSGEPRIIFDRNVKLAPGVKIFNVKVFNEAEKEAK